MIGRVWKTGEKQTSRIIAGPAVLEDDLTHDWAQIVGFVRGGTIESHRYSLLAVTEPCPNTMTPSMLGYIKV
jgi:hypothetical protein